MSEPESWWKKYGVPHGSTSSPLSLTRIPASALMKLMCFGIFAAELAGDLRIGADGIAAKHFAVLTDGAAHILRPQLPAQNW